MSDTVVFAGCRTDWWMESRKKKKEESPESEKETEKKENRLAAGMKNWFGKHRQTLCTLLICAMGCGLLVVLLYPYKCREEDVTIWPSMTYTVNSTGREDRRKMKREEERT